MPIDLKNLCPLLQVFDMPVSLAFYRDTLGFAVEARSGPGDDIDWCLLRLGGAALMLNTAYERHERPPAADPARRAAHADTGLFFACAQVDETYRFLRAKGVAVEAPVVQGYGMKQIYVSDPDGYVLCFQQPAASATGNGEHS